MRILLSLVLLLGTYVCLSEAIGTNVQLPLGSVQGFTKDGLTVFLGIPYATPPVGDLRFTVSTAGKAWSSPLMATNYPPLCMQPSVGLPMSEDCLYINIYVPSGAKSEVVTRSTSGGESVTVQGNTPVMVWIHGGAYQLGGSTSPIYPGDSMAKSTGTIVVVLQYRLGPLGFVTVPGMIAEDKRQNHGLLDQQLALKFVNEYIGYFGGNASAVTIFGESAGGGSVAWHLTNEGSWPYFARVIAESPGPPFYPTLRQALAVGEQVASRVGCAMTQGEMHATSLETEKDATLNTGKSLSIDSAQSQLACLRAKSAKSFTDRVWTTPLGAIPIIDDFYTPESPSVLFSRGHSRPHTPVMVGSNEQEGNLFMLTTSLSTTASWASILALEWIYLTPFYNQSQIDTVQSFYNQYWSSPHTYFQGGSEMVADVLIDCAVVFMSNFLAQSRPNDPSSPVFRYLFTHKPHDWILGFLNSTHLAEVPFVFNTAEFMGMRFSPTEIAFADQISKMWGQFAKTGQPTQHLADWPAYNGYSQSPIRILDINPPNMFTSLWKHDICSKYLPFVFHQQK